MNYCHFRYFFMILDTWLCSLSRCIINLHTSQIRGFPDGVVLRTSEKTTLTDTHTDCFQFLGILSYVRKQIKEITTSVLNSEQTCAFKFFSMCLFKWKIWDDLFTNCGKPVAQGERCWSDCDTGLTLCDYRHTAARVTMAVVVLHFDSPRAVDQSAEEMQSGSLRSPGRWVCPLK